MILLKFLLKNYVFSVLFFLALFIFGGISFSKLKVELLPNIKLPAITILTQYHKGSAEEVESLVTLKVEESLSTIEGLQNIRSLSTTGYSVVELFFEWGYNLDRAIIDVRKNLDFVKNTLPQDTVRPIIIRGKSETNPALSIAVNNISYSSLNFEKELIKNIKGELSQISGSGKVEIKGLNKNQIKVVVDPKKLEKYRLTLQDISEQISGQNILASVGMIEDKRNEYHVKIASELKSIEDVREIKIRYADRSYTLLKNLGHIFWGTQKERSFAKVNGETAVIINHFKEDKENTIQFVEKVKKKISWLNKKYHNKIKFKLIYDQANFIKLSIQNLIFGTIIGVLAGFLVLYLFYRSFLLCVIVILSIPISFLIIFLLMAFFKISINLMTLGGMALGSGMILDASIIVLDRLLKIDLKGDVIPKITNTVSRVIHSILSSTLSTLVVFLPILFLEGLLSTIFKEMALAITFSLIASIFYSITFLPVLFYIISRTNLKKFLNPQKLNLNKMQGGLLKVISLFRRFRFLKYVVILITLIQFFSFIYIPKEIIPYTHMGKLDFYLELLPQSSLERTKKVEKDLFLYLNQLSLKNKTIYSEAGIEENSFLFYDSQKGINRLKTSLVYENEQPIKKKIESYLTNQFLKEHPYLKIQIQEEQPSFTDFLYSHLAKDKVIVASGSRKKLENWVEQVEAEEEQLYKYKPSYWLKFKSDKILASDFDKLNIASEIWTWLNGNKDNSVILNEEQYTIHLSLPEASQKNFTTLNILNNNKISHPIKNLIQIEKKKYKTHFYRMEHQFIEYVKPLSSRSNIVQVPIVQAPLKSKPADNDFSLLPSSEEKEVERSQTNFFFSFLLSLFLIYLIISSQFNSFVKSFPILLVIYPCVAFTTTVLFLFQHSLNVFSGIGLILLAGSSVNSAILIFEGLQNKLSVERVIEERMVPVSITSITTIVALLPIALYWGKGNEFNSLIAICLISGIFVSFFFSMIFLPAMSKNKLK